MLNGTSHIAGHHFQLMDFQSRLDPKLSSLHLDTSIRAERAQQRYDMIEEQLSFAAVYEFAGIERYPHDQVYLDIVPIFISAVVRVFVALKSAGIEFKGFDAETYFTFFTSGIEIDLARPKFGVARVPGWI
jgi:hypothetical protein